MTDLHGLNPEKIAFLGDVHADTAYLKKALKHCKQNGVQVVVQVGDMGIFGNYDRTLCNVMSEFPDMKLLFIDGNHEDFSIIDSWDTDCDDVFWLDDDKQVGYLPRGVAWMWQGKTFAAMGGAVSVDRKWRTAWFDWFPQERAGFLDYKNLLNNTAEWYLEDIRIDYMITHDAPMSANIPLPNSNNYPSNEIAESEIYRRDFMEPLLDLRPRQWYHGHYHVNYTDSIPLGDGDDCTVVGLNMNRTPFDESVHIVDLLQED